MLASLVLTTVSFTEAQQGKKIYRVGYLDGSTFSGSAALVETFRQRLRELGYVEGQGLVIEYRFADGKSERIPDLANELVRLKVDVIVVSGGTAALAAKVATKTIPIVMAAAADPVGAGLIDSLARPGGNVTGLTTIASELSGKRLELLKEALPGLSLVAVLLNPNEPGSAIAFKEMEVAAEGLRLQLQSFEVRGASDFDKAFAVMTKKPARALMVIRGGVTNANEARIVDFAVQYRLPAMSSRSGFVEAGGLMFYGVNDADLYRRAATFVDKILNGAKPSDLPVEQPMRFDLIINLKTAKQIGVKIPPEVLARASKIIR
jgi:putative ABC transport system substrate-binding protein